MLLFVGLILVAPATVSPGIVTVLQYLTTTRRSKLLAGFLPQSGLVLVVVIMFLAQDYEGIVLFFGVELFNEVNVNVLEYATLLFPPWTLLACLFEIWSAEITAELYNRQRTVPSLPSFPEGATIVTTVSVRTWRVVFPTWTYALAAAKEEEDHSKTPRWYSSPCEGATIVGFTQNGVLLELLFLVLNGVVYLGIASYCTSGYYSGREAVFGQKRKGISLMVDLTNPLATPVLLNLLDTALLRMVTRQRAAHIVARVSEMLLRNFTA